MVSYRKLWDLMFEKNVSQADLIRIGISTSTLNTLRHNGNVQTYTLARICLYLDCLFSDIAEVLQPGITEEKQPARNKGGRPKKGNEKRKVD